MLTLYKRKELFKMLRQRLNSVAFVKHMKSSTTYWFLLPIFLIG